MIGFWYEAKLFVEHSTSIENGTLHVVLGVLAWLALAMLWRGSVSSWRPWLVLLVLTVWNEFADLSVERWPNPGMQYGESAADLILTMLVPTVILLAVRWRPELFVKVHARKATLEVGALSADYSAVRTGLNERGEEANGMADVSGQDALFQIEGPDEDGCVWACSPDGRNVWCRNLGPTDKVVEVMSQWLGSIDADELDGTLRR